VLSGVELVSIDSMQVYRGMDIGTAKPTAAERAEVPHHLIDIADPSEDFTVVRFREACDEALAAIEARGNQAVLVGGTGLYVRAVIDRLEPPGEWPAIRSELEAEPDVTALHVRLEAIDPLAASRMTSTNRRRIVRALEVSLGSGKPFSSFGPGLTTYARPESPGRAADAARFAHGADSLSIRRPAGRGLRRRGRRARRREKPLSRTASQALGYRRAARPSGATLGSTKPSTSRSPVRASSRCARSAGSAATADRVGRRDRTGQSIGGGAEPAGRLVTMHLSKHHGLGNDFLVLLRDDVVPMPDDVAAALAIRLCHRTRGSAPTACSSAVRQCVAAADLQMWLYNADGRGGDERQRHPLPRPSGAARSRSHRSHARDLDRRRPSRVDAKV
jgi:tRNA A37 N6-isopentenylltransferase MiaA